MDSVVLKALTYSRYQIIKEWDFSPVMSYLSKTLSWYSADTIVMKREYQRFLAIATSVSENERMPISHKVDPFWSAHVLMTEDYRRLCKKLSIDCVHYFPGMIISDPELLMDQYRTVTLPNYIAYFGRPDPNWWPEQLDDILGFTQQIRRVDVT